MNTNDVERRLEALAAQSADPAVPKALFDGLAALEAPPLEGNAVWKLGDTQPHRKRRANRVKGITALGLAAAFALTGSLLYVAGSHYRQINPSPLPSGAAPTPTRPAPTSADAASIGQWSNPGNPLTLGTWSKVHTFTGAINQFRNVTLSWQDGMIVGLADGWDSGWRNTCVLASRDGGRTWTCNELPRPGTCGNSRDNCLIPGAVAVREGRWIAVAELDPALVDGNYTRLQTWTSNDGTHWTEQVNARFDIGNLYPEYPGVPYIQILPTASGILLAGYRYPLSSSTYPSALWSTSDGTSWQPVVVHGARPLGRVEVDGDAAAGYVAFGYCSVRTPTTNASGAFDPGSQLCAAHSSDGTNWTMTDPLATLPTDLRERMRLARIMGVSRYAGRWVVPLEYQASPSQSPEYYEASSADGVAWKILRITVLANEEISTLDAYSRGPDGWVAFGAGLEKVFYPSIYWSPNGLVSERIGPAPEPTNLGNQGLAMARTPTGVVIILWNDPTGYSDPAKGLTVTAWYAPIT